MPLEGDTHFEGLKKAYCQRNRTCVEKRWELLVLDVIGQAVAKIALGLGMKVIAVDKYVREAVIRVDFYNDQFINVRH